MRSTNFVYRQHIDKICLKASILSAMLFGVNVSHDKAALIKLFNTNVRPTVEYVAQIIDPY